jgi:tetratricopeptide (TPR) repeat protein
MEVLEAIGSDNDWASEVVRSYMAGIVNRKGKNYVQARKSYEAMLAHLRKVLPPKHPIALLALGDYAGFLFDIGDHRTLEPIAKELMAMGDSIYPGHKKLIDAKLKFACERLRSYNFTEATKLYEEVMAHQISSGVFPEEAHYGLTQCLRSFKRPEEALLHAQALWGHRAGKTASQVAWCAFTYARALDESGRTDDAKQMDERALVEAVIELHFPKDPISLERLASIHDHNGEFARAEKLLREAVDTERRERPATHPRVADRIASLANILLKQQKTDEAHSLLRESLAIRQESLPVDDARVEENIRALRQAAGKDLP